MWLVIPKIWNKWTFVKLKWVVSLEHELIIKNGCQFPCRNFDCHLFHIIYIIKNGVELLLSSCEIKELISFARIEPFFLSFPFVPDVRKNHEIVASHVVIFWFIAALSPPTQLSAEGGVRQEIKTPISLWSSTHWGYLFRLLWKSEFGFFF